MWSLRHYSYNLCPSLCSSGKSQIAVQIHHKAVTSSNCPQNCFRGWHMATPDRPDVHRNMHRSLWQVCTTLLCAFWASGYKSQSEWKGKMLRSLTLISQMSRLKARMSRSKSPMLAAWKSSGWSSMDKAILRAAQMFPDITCWHCCRLRLFLWRLKAVRKLLAASLQKQQRQESAFKRGNLTAELFSFEMNPNDEPSSAMSHWPVCSQIDTADAQVVAGPDEPGLEFQRSRVSLHRLLAAVPVCEGRPQTIPQKVVLEEGWLS